MKNYKMFLPVLWIFIFLNVLFLILKNFFEKNGFDQEVLIYANLLLFGVSAAAFFLQNRGLKATNPHAFVRSVYLSMIMKLVICMIVVIIYITRVGGDVNKPSLFLSMALYLIYTSVEVMALMKSARKNTNG